jgi:hypothetical protein
MFGKSTDLGTIVPILEKVPTLVLLPEYRLSVFSPISVSVPTPVPETSGIGIGTHTEIPTTFL